MSTLVSVIVPHRNDWDRLDACVRGLLQQEAGDFRWELIVVDNASDDADAARRFHARHGSRVRFVTQPRLGAAHARNLGVEQAGGDILVFIDSDCLPARDWLRELVTCARQNGYCGGSVELCFAGRKLSSVELFEKVFAFRQKIYVTQKKFSVTANLAVRRGIFLDVGPFRPGLAEDLDWGRRAARRGYEIVYCASAQVRHPARVSYGDLRRKWRRLCAEEVALRRSEGQRNPRLAAQAAMVALSPFAHLARCWRVQDLSVWDRARCTAALFYIRWYRVWRYFCEATAAGPQDYPVRNDSPRKPERLSS
jgi:GT2 family glycosyltransferase